MEDLASENNMKTLKIAQLENFNSRFMKTIVDRKDNEFKENTLMRNLRGILSPNQYKKIHTFINNNCQDTTLDLQRDYESNVLKMENED